jgi:hypothetical protein
MISDKSEIVVTEGQFYQWSFKNGKCGLEIKGIYKGKEEHRILLTDKARKALKLMFEGLTLE